MTELLLSYKFFGAVLTVIGLWLSGAGILGEKRLQGIDNRIRELSNKVGLAASNFGKWAFKSVSTGFITTANVILLFENILSVESPLVTVLLVPLIALLILLSVLKAIGNIISRILEIILIGAIILGLMAIITEVKPQSPKELISFVIFPIFIVLIMIVGLIVRKKNNNDKIIMRFYTGKFIISLIAIPLFIIALIPASLLLVLAIFLTLIMSLLWLSILPYRTIDKLVERANLQSTIVVIGLILGTIGAFLAIL